MLNKEPGMGKTKTMCRIKPTYTKNYSQIIKDYAKRELFIQFIARIYAEIPNCFIGQFSTLKHIQAPYFKDFRNYFQAELKSMFAVPASTFDNVKGKFPIGFFIWDTSSKSVFTEILSDIFNSNGHFECTKKFVSYDNCKNINEWLRPTWNNSGIKLAYLTCNSNDFQNSNGVFIQLNKSNETSTYYKPITNTNLIESTIYYSVRHCIEATWLNDRDQFLYPNDAWLNDKIFQSDCLTFALFNNNIQSNYGTNHWIPFTEQEVNAREKFESNFMTKFMAGKIEIDSLVREPDIFYGTQAQRQQLPDTPNQLEFSTEAKEVFDAGRELWKYYHAQPNCNVNASFYDIREHFQGRNEKGKMNSKSEDETYTELLANLRAKLQAISKENRTESL